LPLAAISAGISFTNSASADGAATGAGWEDNAAGAEEGDGEAEPADSAVVLSGRGAGWAAVVQPVRTTSKAMPEAITGSKW
jgi:hypothetical protein